MPVQERKSLVISPRHWITTWAIVIDLILVLLSTVVTIIGFSITLKTPISYILRILFHDGLNEDELNRLATHLLLQLDPLNQCVIGSGCVLTVFFLLGYLFMCLKPSNAFLMLFAASLAIIIAPQFFVYFSYLWKPDASYKAVATDMKSWFRLYGDNSTLETHLWNKIMSSPPNCCGYTGREDFQVSFSVLDGTLPPFCCELKTSTTLCLFDDAKHSIGCRGKIDRFVGKLLAPIRHLTISFVAIECLMLVLVLLSIQKK